MDLFERCDAFYDDAESARRLGYPANPRTLIALGLYPYFIPIGQSEGSHVVIEGKRLLMLGSNNYLGLTTHPRVKQAAEEAIRRFGTGCTGSRLMNGTLALHEELECRLAAFVGKQGALVFSTGYQTNLGVISALLRGTDFVLADHNSHASIVDGIQLAGARDTHRARFFHHNDAGHLDSLLAALPPAAGKLVVVDGVFSMEGDIAPLPELSAVCRRHAARLMVDDAHALGVLGGGRGTAFHFGRPDDADLVMGTFSKSLASAGGFIAGPRTVIHWIKHFARPFLFSASLPPANAATVLAALDVVEQEPERVARVVRIAARMREALRADGWDLGQSATPIVPLIIGDQFRTVQTWRRLFDAGIYTNAALPPAVRARRGLVRTSYMATHSDEALEEARDLFHRVRERMPARPSQPRARLERAHVG